MRFSTVAAILLIFHTDYHLFSSNALLLKCPIYQMHLQKIVGLRPPLEYLAERNLIYRPTSNFKDRNRSARDGYHVLNAINQTTPLMQSDAVTTPQTPTVSTICWRICQADDDCIAYVHLLDTNECYGYTYFERAHNYLTVSSEMPLVADAEAIFYEKTCLKVPEACKNRLWTLTKIPGNSLVFHGKKTIQTLVTRRECAENCLFETEFQCLSASFAPSRRNNRDRFSQHSPLPGQPHDTLGRCILSDKDKMIQPDAFRAAPYDEEYIENQCYERAIENANCSYELYANSSFVYAEAKYVGLTQRECQSRCSHEARFYCQGVSFYYESVDLTQSECALHSEDIISMGPRSLKFRENSVYMRRVKCLDVQVVCRHNEMSIQYKPRDWFSGKMYASQHSEDCMVRGNGTGSTQLRLSIGSEVKENRCGILRAYEVTNDYQRIFISALVVIQNNPNVQTQGDRLIKVGCIMSNSSFTTVAASKVDNDYDSDPEDSEDGEEAPNAVALESSLAFTQQSLPNEGSVHFNITDGKVVPKITLQIIDLAHQHETSDVQIGQNLELQIVAEYTLLQQQLLDASALPPLPDFRAASLVAHTQNNQNYVSLIDERGCPTDVTVFPALQRTNTRLKKILYARFHAFKFAGTSTVNFDVKIHFCAPSAPCPENCVQYGSGSKEAWRTRRRRRQAPPEQQQRLLKLQNPVYISTVMDVASEPPIVANRTQDLRWSNRTNAQLELELPLNYNLRVHGPDMTNSNSFIYGERGVLLIAGIDDQLHLDNLCLNQSLLIAVFIFWLIFQVALCFSCCYAIQKYKRLAALDDERRKIHEEYLESRRVHWADQGGYTL